MLNKRFTNRTLNLDLVNSGNRLGIIIFKNK